MSTQDQICLLVRRAGTTEIFSLANKRRVEFGYAPSDEEGLILHDGALEDIHGVIEYQSAPTPEQTASNRRLTNFWLRAFKAGIEVGAARLSDRSGVTVQLSIGDEIRVGDRYLLIVADYPIDTLRAALSIEKEQKKPITTRQEWLIADQQLRQFLKTSRLFLSYLPEIYQSSDESGDPGECFLPRFLALFESVFLPIKWTVENCDLLFDPDSAPADRLAWLASWYGLPFFDDQHLAVSQQRNLLRQTPSLMARKGTVGGLCDLLQFYTGYPARSTRASGAVQSQPSATTPPIIIIDDVSADNVTFSVTFDPAPLTWQRQEIEELINWFKPTYANFKLRGWPENSKSP